MGKSTARACLDDEVMLTFVSGCIDPRVRQQVLQHIERCDECADVVARLARLHDDETAALGSDAETSSQAERLAAGTQIGRFSLLHCVGQGGMGEVYAAYDPQLDRKVAIKLLIRGGREPAESSLRMAREARALAQLRHDNVISVFDAGVDAGRMYLAMEFVEGDNLAEHLRTRHFAWREILALFVAAGQGLAAVHAAELLHRDFKPTNVLVASNGRVVLADFGLAKTHRIGAVDELRAPASAQFPNANEHTSLTAAGTVAGTLGFLAPERLRGEPASPAADQYAYCVALFEAIFGQRPFIGDTAEELALSIDAGRVRSDVDLTAVPRWLSRSIVRGLAADPAARWPSMKHLLDRLARAQRMPWHVRARWPAAAGSLASAGAVSLWVAPWAARSNACEFALDSIEQVWGPEQRARFAAGASPDDAPFVAESLQRVQLHLDAFAMRWVGQHRDACQDAQAGKEAAASTLDLRMACLQRSKAAMRQTVEVLETQPRAQTLPHAVDAVLSLPAPELCADAQRLARQWPPPDDPRLATAVVLMRAELASVAALARAGRYDAAAAVLSSLSDPEAAVQHPPLRAEVALQTARVRSGLGDHDSAATFLREALAAAIEVGDDKIAADAATLLVSTVGDQLADLEAGATWAKLAAAASFREGTPPTRIRYLLAAGGYWTRARQFDEAFDTLHEALELAESLEIPDLVLQADAHRGLGRIALERDDLDAAWQSLSACRRVRESLYGPHHPLVAEAVANLGIVRSRQRRSDEALALYSQALRLFGETLGRDHPTLGNTYTNIGAVHHFLGDYDAAIAAHRRAVDLAVTALGPDHPDLANSFTNLASSLTAAGRPEEALPHLEHAVAVIERKYGPHAGNLGIPVTSLGRTQLALGRVEEAVVTLRRGRAILAADTSADPLVADLFLARALWLASAANGPEAIEVATHALRQLVIKEQPGPAAELRAWFESRGVQLEVPDIAPLRGRAEIRSTAPPDRGGGTPNQD